MAVIRQASRLVALTVVLALVLFGSAGTPRWRAAWAFLALTIALTTAYVLVVVRVHPGLVQERTAPPPDAKQWDKPLVAAVAIVGPLVTVATAGLDRRFGWTPPLPAAVKAAGLLAIALAGALTCLAVACNPFFSSVVRIQRDRGHAVVEAGPYAFVRHPGYAASVLHMLATPLALGALAAYVPVAVLVALTLARRLDGPQVRSARHPGGRVSRRGNCSAVVGLRSPVIASALSEGRTMAKTRILPVAHPSSCARAPEGRE